MLRHAVIATLSLAFAIGIARAEGPSDVVPSGTLRVAVAVGPGAALAFHRGGQTLAVAGAGRAGAGDEKGVPDVQLWDVLARRYAALASDRLFFEVMNEPPVQPALWNKYGPQLAAAIRASPSSRALRPASRS